MKKILVFSLMLLLVSTSVLAQYSSTQSRTEALSEAETKVLLGKIIKAHEDIKSFYIEQTCVHSFDMDIEEDSFDIGSNIATEIVSKIWYRFPYLHRQVNYSTKIFFSSHSLPPIIELIDQQKKVALFSRDGEKTWEERPFDELFHHGANRPLHLGDFFPCIMLTKDENKYIDSAIIRQADEKTCQQILVDKIYDGNTYHYLLKASFVLKWAGNVEKVHIEYLIDPQTYLVVGAYSDDFGIAHEDLGIEEYLSKGYSWQVKTIINPDIPAAIFQKIINH